MVKKSGLKSLKSARMLRQRLLPTCCLISLGLFSSPQFTSPATVSVSSLCSTCSRSQLSLKSILVYYFDVKKRMTLLCLLQLIYLQIPSFHLVGFPINVNFKGDQLHLLFRPCGWKNNMQWNHPRKRCRWISYYQYWKTVPWSAFSDTCHCRCCLGNNKENRLVTWVCGKRVPDAGELWGLAWVELPLSTSDWNDKHTTKVYKKCYTFVNVTGQDRIKENEEHAPCDRELQL